jgi:formylglycine-generating enzyme required for sulfatase activity
MDMIWCPPGTFTMGSPTTEAGRGSNETEHNVSLSRGFYLGKYEVTQAQYEAVTGTNPSQFNATGNGNRPVEKVNWTEAVAFCTQLTTQEQAAGRLPAGWAYVLPTESQWEYACRAGTTTAYSWGATIASSNANYNWDGGANDGNDFKQTRDVGQFSANPWGFFDMHGNVWEWTADRFWATYPTGNPVVDPTRPASGTGRVTRGGSWVSDGTGLRSARRHYYQPGARYNPLGFRVGFQKSQ